MYQSFYSFLNGLIQSSKNLDFITPLRNFRSQLKVTKFEEKDIRHCHR